MDEADSVKRLADRHGRKYTTLPHLKTERVKITTSYFNKLLAGIFSATKFK